MAVGATLHLPVSAAAATAGGGRARRRCPGGFAEILRGDRDFIRGAFDERKSLRLPNIAKSLSDAFWFRHLEDPLHGARPPPSLPKPSYPGLTGVDLMMADLEALKGYAQYYSHVLRIWSMPLPEVYGSERITEYFKGRPHVLAFRIFEIFFAFGSAMVKLRTLKILGSQTFGIVNDGVGSSSGYYMGQLLKESMLNLGPTFIKVGQSLSTRPDLIGSEIAEVLAELHEKIPSFPRDVAMDIVEKELGCSIKKAFSYISEEPVASASFGQVYRGCTLDGFNVAVKVQRPNVRETVIRDIYLLRRGLGILRKLAKRKSDISLYADELGRGFVAELDYRIEAHNASEFLNAHASYPFMYVPKVLKHLSRKRVLTMEWVAGDNPNDLLLSIRSGPGSFRIMGWEQLEIRKRLLNMVNKGVEATLVQLLETGLLHADPHAGNLRYTLSEQIGFLDFGLLCRMEKKHQNAILSSILHIVTGDWASLVYDFIEMDMVWPGTNLHRVTMELKYSLAEVVFEDGVPNVKFSLVLGKIWSVAFKYHFKMPPYYVLLLRSLASFEGLAVAVDPDFKTFQAAYPFVVRKLLTDNSASTRKILHSIVFNKEKEFQWHRLALFLKVGTTSRSIQRLVSVDKVDQSTSQQNIASGQIGGSDVDHAHMILRLLLSENGAVLRRLLMTVDARSFVRSMISKEAATYRQYLCRALSDLLYQWIVQATDNNNRKSHFDSSSMSPPVVRQTKTIPAASKDSPALLLLMAMRDRRIKIISSRILKTLRRDPVLTLKLCWSCLVPLFSASAMACHRFLVSVSEVYIDNVAGLPGRFAVNA